MQVDSLQSALMPTAVAAGAAAAATAAQPAPTGDAGGDDPFSLAKQVASSMGYAPLTFVGVLLVGVAVKKGLDWTNQWKESGHLQRQKQIAMEYEKCLSNTAVTPKEFLTALLNDGLFVSVPTIHEWESKLNKTSNLYTTAFNIIDELLYREFSSKGMTLSLIHLFAMHAVELTYLKCDDRCVQKVRAVASFARTLADLVRTKQILKESMSEPHAKEQLFLRVEKAFRRAADQLQAEQNDIRFHRENISGLLRNHVHHFGALLFKLTSPASKVRSSLDAIIETVPITESPELPMLKEIVELTSIRALSDLRWREKWAHFSYTPIQLPANYVLKDTESDYILGIRSLGHIALWRLDVEQWKDDLDLNHVSRTWKMLFKSVTNLLSSYRKLREKADHLRMTSPNSVPKAWLARVVPINDRFIDTREVIPVLKKHFEEISRLRLAALGHAAERDRTIEVDLLTMDESEPIAADADALEELTSIYLLHQALRQVISNIGGVPKCDVADLCMCGLEAYGFEFYKEEKRAIQAKLVSSPQKWAAFAKMGTIGAIVGGLIALPEPVISNTLALLIGGVAGGYGVVSESIDFVARYRVNNKGDVDLAHAIQLHYGVLKRKTLKVTLRADIINHQRDIDNRVVPNLESAVITKVCLRYIHTLSLLGVMDCFKETTPIWRFLSNMESELLEQTSPPLYSSLVSQNQIAVPTAVESPSYGKSGSNALESSAVTNVGQVVDSWETKLLYIRERRGAVGMGTTEEPILARCFFSEGVLKIQYDAQRQTGGKANVGHTEHRVLLREGIWLTLERNRGKRRAMELVLSDVIAGELLEYRLRAPEGADGELICKEAFKRASEHQRWLAERMRDEESRDP
ncbi:hypothetical protein BJ742DRAFT_846745 [Cladochytrium replicatum]|nr:hypothetical protein BJ742DRAFT_846745 [Cladochytrium replicatum]